MKKYYIFYFAWAIFIFLGLFFNIEIFFTWAVICFIGATILGEVEK